MFSEYVSDIFLCIYTESDIKEKLVNLEADGSKMAGPHEAVLLSEQDLETVVNYNIHNRVIEVTADE